MFQLLKAEVVINAMLPWMLLGIMHCVAQVGGGGGGEGGGR